MSPEIEKKDIYKAVSNYMANELGIDRNAILSMLEQKIEERNIDQLIKEAVARYFHAGHDAFQSAEIVRKSVQRSVNEHIRDELSKGGSGYLDGLLQTCLDQITGRSPISQHTSDAPHRPNLDVYGAAMKVRHTLATAAIQNWVKETFPADRKITVNCSFDPNQFTSWYADLAGLLPKDKPLLDRLAEDAGQNSQLQLRGSPFDASVTLSEKLCNHILSKSLGWFEIEESIPYKDGLILLPRKS